MRMKPLDAVTSFPGKSHSSAPFVWYHQDLFRMNGDIRIRSQIHVEDPIVEQRITIICSWI